LCGVVIICLSTVDKLQVISCKVAWFTNWLHGPNRNWKTGYYFAQIWSAFYKVKTL